MQVVLSLGSTKVTGVSGNTISDLYYPCQQSSILSMCCSNKTITTLNQCVFIVVFVTFTSRIYFIFGLFVLWPVYNIV